MFEYIHGKIVEKTPNYIAVDVGGVGYKILISLRDYANLPDFGEKALVYTHFHVKEDEQTLFGFLEKTSRKLFEHFIAISGIGPKTALALIGHLDYEALEIAVLSNNIALICKTPGIGKKTAERLILEMKDKLGNAKTAASFHGSSTLMDATQALINLGYTPLLAQKAVQKAMQQNKSDLAEIITLALKEI